MSTPELKKRKWISPVDFAIIFGVLLVCGFALFFFTGKKPQEVKAVIFYDGKAVKEINLGIAPNEIFTLEENRNVSFEINENRIRFVNTECPDKLCENFGYLKRSGEIAVCLPNRVSLKIMGVEGEKDKIDAIVGR